MDDQDDMTLRTDKSHTNEDPEVNILHEQGQPPNINNNSPVRWRHGEEPIMIEEEEQGQRENEDRRDVRG